ncbi:MAG: histidine kinase [Crocinitomicaceae bacterium]|nr:histidine kinase [Crocinitomicaceae bacterium]
MKIRINRERELNEKEKMQFRSRLLALEQQSLNASMNRHFIFNSLNSIQYFINTQDKLSANRFLTNFAQLIRKNLDSAGHDGNMIPLSKEIERLKLYLSLEAMRFKDKFSYEFQIEPQDLDGIYLPAMLLQPFVENSIIHGILPNQNQKGVIMISIQERNNCLEIKIEDNGIGISNSLKQKESFMGDHKSQGMEITAKRIELIKKISNQAFEIVGPIDRINEDSKINGTYVLLKIPLNILDNLD